MSPQNDAKLLEVAAIALGHNYGHVVTDGNLTVRVLRKGDEDDHNMLLDVDELKLAGARIRVKGTIKEAAELVDMLVAAGDQRGDMMLEYTKQATCEAFRALLKELGVPVPCDCGKADCEGEMQEGCGHLANVEQLEFNASLEERIDDDGLR